MSLRRRIAVIPVLAALGVPLAVACARPTGPRHGPARIVLIVVDMLRADQLAAFGPSGTTPHIDALASRGRALGALASFHQTTMSMGALFTGRTPSIESTGSGHPLPWDSNTWCGLARFAEASDMQHCLPAALPTLAEALRAAGYSTIGVVSNPLLFEPAGFGRGFDDWTEVGRVEGVTGPLSQTMLLTAAESRAGPVVNRAVDEALARRESDRFFLYVHFMDAHDHQEMAEGGSRATGTPGSTSSPRSSAYSYRDGVRRADAAVGALLRHLEAAGLLEGAVVILTSDHGERLGERHALPGLPQHRGNPAFDTLLRVPLVVAPDRIGAGEGSPIRTQDLFWLVLEIAELETPDRADASDLARDELYLSELHFQTLRTERWKSLHRRSDGRVFLFDLSADSGETRDVADAHPEMVAVHRARVTALSQSLSAPGRQRDDLNAEERQRLGVLGYLEDALGERETAGNR